MDMQSVVPLDENSLLKAAMDNTGLSDFGEDGWREGFQRLIKSADEESELNLLGRMIARSNILLYLQARLQIEDTYKRHPEINDEQITKPLFILGQGRSGTSTLHNVLGSVPDYGVLKGWEVYFPCPPPESSTYLSDPRIEQAEKHLTRVYRICPEYRAMHEFGGNVPTENIEMHCITFTSSFFTATAGQVPGYMQWLHTQDILPVFEYEKKVLKLLQWRNPRKHWVFKSPINIAHIPELLKVYPDIGFIWTHRDPVKALSSVVSMLGTLFWSMSDHPFLGDSLAMLTNPQISAAIMNQVIDHLESGLLPKEQLCNIHFKDLVADPLSTIRHIHDYFHLEFTGRQESAVEAFLSARIERRQSQENTHRYETGEKATIASERQAYARYQAYFNVPNEI